MTEQEFQIELWDLFCKAIEENLFPTQVLFSLKFCEVRFKENILETLKQQGPKLTEIWLAESEVLSKIEDPPFMYAGSWVSDGFIRTKDMMVIVIIGICKPHNGFTSS